ncbi:MAG TPA: IS630 family transposase [Candidatus Methylomirabilis sp.]|nr:IS630 family transposase [Candidatus Methylomirabilis sp.]
MEKFKVTLTVEERQALDRMVSSGKAAARKLVHARILLLGDEGPGGPRCTDEEIVEALNIGFSTIVRVRRRFVTESLESAIHPRPRPPRPDKVKIQGEVEQQLIRLACSDPPAGRCCWTLELLADKLIALGCFPNVCRETVRKGAKKNDIQPWVVKTWCLPPKADADFVWHMEDVLEVYQLPYDPTHPVVCMDEASKQLIGEVAIPVPAAPGRAARIDYEYERKGTCNLFMMCEPLRGWRHVRVTERRTRRDWAECIKELVDVHYPAVEKIRLVMDNLNTHNGASLYEAFPPVEARRLLDRLEVHPTPKHGSWLDMAETELSILHRQCLNRRIDEPEEVRREVGPWEKDRNERECRIHWTFTLAAARIKLKRLYPSIKG